MSDEIPLILFAKAPTEGKVKTRLMPKLTAQQATRAAEVLLEETIKLVVAAWRGKVILAVWPDMSHPFINRLLKIYDVECVLQVEGNLGAKMSHAMDSQGYPCAVMGCDVPHCDPEIIVKAYQALRDSKNAIGLTHDGGYYFLGLQAACSSLFQSVDWGSETVARSTLVAAKKSNLAFERLTMLNDIDEYEDLVLASSQISALARLLP